MYPAGLLAWFILNTFPSALMAGQWFEVSVKVRAKLSLTNLTATGIAPELHRTSLLIPFVTGTKYSAKMVVDSIKNKLLSVCRNINSFLSTHVYRLNIRSVNLLLLLLFQNALHNYR